MSSVIENKCYCWFCCNAFAALLNPHKQQRQAAGKLASGRCALPKIWTKKHVKWRGYCITVSKNSPIQSFNLIATGWQTRQVECKIDNETVTEYLCAGDRSPTRRRCQVQCPMRSCVLSRWSEWVSCFLLGVWSCHTPRSLIYTFSHNAQSHAHRPIVFGRV